jgi:hypothetical protein
MKSWKLTVAVLTFAVASAAQTQDTARIPGRSSKTPPIPAFVCSNYFWTWFQNGSTTFTFSMKNQSGHDVKTVRYRVLFFDRQGNQIDFAEGTTGPIPNGLAHRESVDLNFDTGMSTRKISTYQKIEILGFEQADTIVLPPPK